MFNSPAFKEIWEVWKKHKAEKHGSPYTPTSEERALSVLFKKCHGIEELAIASIDYSIEHNWAAIYVQNNYGNGNGQTNGSTTSTKQNGTSSDRMEAARKW